jgi:hypothetical protein
MSNFSTRGLDLNHVINYANTSHTIQLADVSSFVLSHNIRFPVNAIEFSPVLSVLDAGDVSNVFTINSTLVNNSICGVISNVFTTSTSKIHKYYFTNGVSIQGDHNYSIVSIAGISGPITGSVLMNVSFYQYGTKYEPL